MRALPVALVLCVSVPALAQSDTDGAREPEAAAQGLSVAGYAGALVPLEDGRQTLPQLGLALAAPFWRGGREGGLRLEGLAALDVTYSRTSGTQPGAAWQQSALTVGVVPALRLVVPLHRWVGVHVDVGGGPALTLVRTRATVDRELRDELTDHSSLLLRGGAGLLLQLGRSLRLQLTPLALQTYVDARASTYVSATAGLAGVLD